MSEKSGSFELRNQTEASGIVMARECGLGRKKEPSRPRRRVGPERRWRMSVIIGVDNDG